MRIALPIVLILASLAAQQPGATTYTEAEKQLIELTNAERKKKNLPPLKANPKLAVVARAHSANMAKQGKMDHHLDGKSPFDRIKAGGYDFSVAGENIGVGDVTVAAVMRAWMGSKVHRDNILEAQFTEIGIGLSRDDRDQFYYTQVFAAPRK